MPASKPLPRPAKHQRHKRPPIAPQRRLPIFLEIFFSILSVYALLFGLDLSRISCQTALRPLFGSVASAYYLDAMSRIIDFFLVPAMNLFCPGLVPSLGASTLLSALLVWRAPDTFGRFIGRYSGKFSAAVGPLVFQLLAYWPIRLFGMSAAQEVALKLTQRRINPVNPSSSDLVKQTAWSVSLPLMLHAISRLMLPWATKSLDAFPTCQMFQVASSILLSITAITTMGQLLISDSREIKRINALIVLGCLLSSATLPSPKSLCHEPERLMRTTSGSGTGAYRLLARRLSLTGLVLVGEYTIGRSGLELRFMRCDHSLLGGFWIGPAREAVLNRSRQERPDVIISNHELEVRASQLAESIYPTFILQEAIWLVQRPEMTLAEAGQRPKALIVGLGVGISARTLMRHGVSVTIVEIDPLVFEYAQRFFALPTPDGGAVLEDAREYLGRSDNGTVEQFDYVIHDVFTGGLVPSSLFTVECWQEVRAKLKDTGVLAVNFAGKPLAEAGSLVLTTLFHVFPFCRAFAEKSAKPNAEGDFQNMVIFCSPSGRPQFRSPTDKDVFGSRHRLKILSGFEKLEFDLSRLVSADWKQRERFILFDREQNRLEKAQLESALHHWKVMRKVLPDHIWNDYY